MTLKNSTGESVGTMRDAIDGRVPELNVCILCGCGCPAHVVGVFTHDGRYNEQFGLTTPGKIRQVVYGICGMCFMSPDAPLRVEDILGV